MIERPSTHGRRLLAQALKIAPAERREWFAAMAAEFDHVPLSAQRRFAFGCLLAAIRERVISQPFADTAARGLLIGGAVFWAGLNLRLAGRMSAADAAVPEALGYGAALIFALGALATARYGYRATIALAAPLMAVLALVAIFLRIGIAQAPLSNLTIALMVEDLVVLAMAVAIAAFASRQTRVRRGHP